MLSDQSTNRSFVSLCLKSGPGGRFEHLPDAVFALGRALQIGAGIYLLGHQLAILRSHRLLFHLHQLTFGGLVVTKILLVADKNDRNIRTEMLNLWCPLFWDVLQGVRTVNGKAHEDDVGVRV